MGRQLVWTPLAPLYSRGKSVSLPLPSSFHKSRCVTRHCAEAVVSCADNSNVVGEIATRLVDFTSRWVRSASSDFDVIVASTLDQEWVLKHKPVLSSKERGHRLYSKIRPAEPDGKLVLCHRRCSAILHTELNSNSTGVKFTCTGCGSTCATPNNRQLKNAKNTALSRRGLLNTVYPQEMYMTQWMLPEPTSPVEHVPPSSPSGHTPANTSAPRPARRLPSRAVRTRAERLSREGSPAVSCSSTTSISRVSSTSTSDQLAVPSITRSPSLPTLSRSKTSLTINLPPLTASYPSTPVTSTSPAAGPPRSLTPGLLKRSEASEPQPVEPQRKKRK